MNKTKNRSVAFILALVLHVGILALFFVNHEEESEVIKQDESPEIIEASLLDDEIIMEEANRLKVHEENKIQAEKQKQAEIENKLKQQQALFQQVKERREAEELKIQALEKQRQENQVKEEKLEAQRRERAIQQKAEAETKRLEAVRQAEAETKRLELIRHVEELKKQQALIAKQKAEVEAEKKRLEEVRKTEEARRRIEEKRLVVLAAQQKAEIKRQKAEQATVLVRQQKAIEAQAKHEQNRRATISISAAIQRKVNNSWIRPVSMRSGMRCTVRVKLLPSGDVMDVSVIKSSGDQIFDRSAENAVRKASPLPVPKDRALFSKAFRSFIFTFNPE